MVQWCGERGRGGCSKQVRIGKFGNWREESRTVAGRWLISKDEVVRRGSGETSGRSSQAHLESCVRAACPPPPPALLFSLSPISVPGRWQVCVLGLHLAKELCEVDEDGDSWLQVTRRLPILPTLLTTLEVSLRMKQNLHFTEASLHLLLTLARTQQVGRKPAGRGEPLACAAWLPTLLVMVPEALVCPRVPAAAGQGGCRGQVPGVMGLGKSQLIPILSLSGSHSSGWSWHHPEHLSALTERVPA